MITPNHIAVIMSVYKNDSPVFFSMAMESLLSQTEQNLDIFLMRDGPVPEALEASIRKYLADQRIHYYTREENKGLAHSLNELLAIVLPQEEYEFIARMDADDISLPKRMERQMDFMKKNPEIDICGTYALEIDAEGKPFFEKKMPSTHDSCRKMMKARSCLVHPSVMFRRSFFCKAGLYPEDTYLAEDLKMWIKGFKAGCRFANIPEYLFLFRLDDHFFERRRGYKHFCSMFKMRTRMAKEMGFGCSGYLYAALHAGIKLFSPGMLRLAYKMRK